MQQNPTSMRFLLIGISLICLSSRCSKESVEYRMTMELSFINSTDSTISFQLRPNLSFSGLENVTLTPHAQSKYFTYDIEGSDKDPVPETCCQFILNGSFASESTNTIKINNASCVTHQGIHSAILSNYTVSMISDRHFQYIYTFNKSNLQDAAPCK